MASHMLDLLPGHLIHSIRNLENVEETGSEVAPLESQVLKQLEKLLLILMPMFDEHFL